MAGPQCKCGLGGPCRMPLTAVHSTHTPRPQTQRLLTRLCVRVCMQAAMTHVLSGLQLGLRGRPDAAWFVQQEQGALEAVQQLLPK